MSEHEARSRTAVADSPATRARLGAWPWVLALIAALALGVLFGKWAFGTPQLEQATDAPATVDVADMTVGNSMPVAVSATWAARPFGVGAANGVLTSLNVEDGDTVKAGDRLYTVDLRPVVAAVGKVPAFRDLSQGARGADVKQLERLLVKKKFLEGPANGTFDRATTRAVKAWQKSLGVKQDGVVRAGDIVYASRLPARVQIADDATVGKRLSAGDVVLQVLDGEPEFVAVIPSGTSVDPSLPIDVTVGDETVPTVVVASRSDQSGNTMLILRRADGSSVCGERCDEVPLNELDAVYPARQVLTPEVTGPGVPAAAVWFTAAGDAYLVLPDGTRVPVTILGQGQGGVVLSGVDPGTTVILAGDTNPQAAQETAAPSADAAP